MSSAVGFAVRNGVAVLRITSPPVNALGAAVRAGLCAGLDCAVEEKARGVVVIGDGATFPAGADITEFGKPPVHDPRSHRLGCGDAAAATWTFRRDSVAATPRPRRGHFVEIRSRRRRRGHFVETRSRRRRGRDVDISWRFGRDAAAAATWTFRGDQRLRCRRRSATSCKRSRTRRFQ